MNDIGNKDTITKLKTMFLGYPQTTLGIHEVLYIDTINGKASAKYIAKNEMCHSGGIVQGGFVTGWIDAIMALACMAKCGSDVLVLTLEIKINFLNSAKIGEIISTAKVIKNTKTIAFIEGKLEDNKGILIATGTCTAKLKHNFYNDK
tara:strand:- start:178 stop:621 length:444 start_codon:yes stop_codon:yes gene_type:complete